MRQRVQPSRRTAPEQGVCLLNAVEKKRPAGHFESSSLFSYVWLLLSVHTLHYYRALKSPCFEFGVDSGSASVSSQHGVDTLHVWLCTISTYPSTLRLTSPLASMMAHEVGLGCRSLQKMPCVRRKHIRALLEYGTCNCLHITAGIQCSLQQITTNGSASI